MATALRTLFSSVADAIRSMDGTSASIAAENFPARIRAIPTGDLKRFILNDTSITPTGTYATAVYYDTAYGVKVGYLGDGNQILVSMRGGTTTAYEYLHFTLTQSNISGLTITANTTSNTNVTAKPALIYACVISGFKTALAGKSGARIAVAMSGVNATYDYTTCRITVTGVS